jgi:hypothetical protein
MTEKQRSAKKEAESPATSEPQTKTWSSEEEKVWAAFEQARQNVKPIVKKEREAEIVSAELLNLRLKAH